MGKVVVTVALGVELLFAGDGAEVIALVVVEQVWVGEELAEVAAVKFGAGGLVLRGKTILIFET